MTVVGRSGIRVTLTPDELVFAAVAGALAQAFAVSRGLTHRYDFRGDGWGVHVEGAAAEMAVAKVFDRFYVPALHPQRDHERDVATFEVRSTPRHDGSLILHPADPDQTCFVLVTGRAPTYVVVGWTIARAGKVAEYWREGDRPAFFVPQSALAPLPDRWPPA